MPTPETMARKTKKAEASWKYPIFFSYSHDDDVKTHYPSTFKEQFDEKLPARLRTAPGLGHLAERQTFFDKTSLPVTGGLTKELKDAIEASFALMIFVDDGYVMSPWCLMELEQFRKKFRGQRDELQNRLFIIVTNEQAEKALLAHERWPKDLVFESIRSQFYVGKEPIRPMMVTTARAGKDACAAPNPVVTTKVDQLLKRLVDLIGENPEDAPRRPTVPDRPKRVLIGPTTDDVAEDVTELVRTLRGLGIEAEQLPPEDLLKSRARADLRERAGDYAYFVQPYSEGAPLLDSLAGGHLGQIQALLQNSLEIMWWRVRVSSAVASIDTAEDLTPHQSTYDQIRPQARHRLASELAMDIDNAIQGDASGDGALVFIESSREQHGEWEGVRDELMEAWRREVPSKRLMCSAFPFNGRKTPELQALGDAHGVVLLFANINYTMLVGRATVIEEVLFRARATPIRFVAWLPKQPPELPHEDYVWTTVAFHRGDPASPLGVPTRIPTIEPERLQQLLREVRGKAGL